MKFMIKIEKQNKQKWTFPGMNRKLAETRC